MKITDIRVQIEPTGNETAEPVILVRADKCWFIQDRAGLYPNEIALATALMQVIQDYNGGKIK